MDPFTNYVTLHFCWSLVDLLHLITMRLIVTSPDMYNFADTSCDWVHAISSLLEDQQFNFKVQAVKFCNIILPISVLKIPYEIYAIIPSHDIIKISIQLVWFFVEQANTMHLNNSESCGEIVCYIFEHYDYCSPNLWAFYGIPELMSHFFVSKVQSLFHFSLCNSEH